MTITGYDPHSAEAREDPHAFYAAGRLDLGDGPRELRRDAP